MPAADDAPVGDSEADALFAPVAHADVVIAAVSGGKDSLALLDLLDRWRRRKRGRPVVHVATVDHGLRPGSVAEARAVVADARRRRMPATLLAWEGAKPRTGIEAAAREARYALLAELAADIGASHVITAHHRDDQAETVLLRLGRGSGLTGLAGMRAERPLAAGVVLFRPFLAVPSSRLAATAAAAGLTPADDETNRNPRFARARLRKAMPALAAEGVTAAGLAR
ncbi:MAG: tRNA lysidine(34) synthetase TilS, partial [Bauldia sp.]|nr:tRNA lysidine(34) synthetase TilS [Bauldia sp.]